VIASSVAPSCENATTRGSPSSLENRASSRHGESASSRTRRDDPPSAVFATAARTTNARSAFHAMTSPGFCVSSIIVPAFKSTR